MKIALVLPGWCLLALAGCDSIPRDQEGTLDRVRAERSYRVGIIASGPPLEPERQLDLLRRIDRSTGARAALELGASEPLLARLEKGELDLVLGPLSPKSPWAKQVAVLPPLTEQVSKEGHVHLVAIARHGENDWISLLHRQAGEVAAKP